jgi:hypothetical protein
MFALFPASYATFAATWINANGRRDEARFFFLI